MAIRSEMRQLTLGVVGETMFGSTDGDAADDVRGFIDAGGALFGPLTFFFAPFMERLPLPSARRFIATRQRLDARVYRMLHERRASGVDHGDLLSMLLLAQDEEGDGQGLTDRQIPRRGRDHLPGRTRDHGERPHLELASPGATPRGTAASARRGQ